jgi:hypothetical protein
LRNAYVLPQKYGISNTGNPTRFVQISTDLDIKEIWRKSGQRPPFIKDGGNLVNGRPVGEFGEGKEVRPSWKASICSRDMVFR